MTMAATKAFSENCVEQVRKDSGGGGQKAFRFVYTSGSLVVRDQNDQTWFMGDGRKMRVCVSLFCLILLLFQYLQMCVGESKKY